MPAAYEYSVLHLMSGCRTLHAIVALHVREADTSFTDTEIIMYSKIGGIKVREDKLSTQSMDFAVMIIQLVKQLKSAHESIISN